MSEPRYYIVEVTGYLAASFHRSGRAKPGTSYTIIDGATGREQARFRTEDYRRAWWPVDRADADCRKAVRERLEQLNREDDAWQN